MRFCTWMALLFAIAMTGCGTPPKPAHMKLRDEPYMIKGDVRIQYLSNSNVLHKRAEIVKHVAERTPEGLLSLRTAIRNHDKHDIVVEIKVTFTDEQGLEKEATNWEPVVLGRYDVTTYTCVSLGTQVRDYRLAIRDPKEFRQDGQDR